MSLIDQYSENILGFRGTLQDAQDLFKAFVGELMIKILNVEQKFQQQVFRNCNKLWPTVQENLSNFFKCTQVPIQAIFNQNKYKNEGFLSSDEEEATKQGNKKAIVKRTKSIIKELPKGNDFKDEQIKIRDQVIQDMTIGYYKDLQHLKEMFLKKDKQEDDEIFDTSYYDITKSFPPEVQVYIQSKLKEASNQAKQSYNKLSQTIASQQHEIEKLRKTIHQLVNQADVSQQIKSILLIDKDLFRFWRGIQDVIGNKQIFEIFEKRIGGYGIDYKQIDELISVSQASNRVFTDFKAKIDEQYLLFTSQIQKELNLCRTQVKIMDDKQNGVEMNKEKDYIQIRQTIKAGIEYIYEMKEAAIKNVYSQKLEEFAENIMKKDVLSQVRKCIKGHALFKWIYIAKCEKMQWQKKLRRTQSFSENQFDVSCNPRGLLDNRVEELKRKLRQEEDSLEAEQLETQQLTVQLNQTKNNYQAILMNYEMQLHKYLYMQQQLVQVENQNKYFEKIFSLLMRRIGYSHFEVNSKNINILLEKADIQMKAFSDKINKLQDCEDLNELTNQLLKKTIVQDKFNRNAAVTSFAQTDIFDTSMKLEECIKYAEKYQQQLSLIDEEQQSQLLREKQQQEKENQISLDDIPNILLSDQEDDEAQQLKLKNKVSFERSTELDTTNLGNFDARSINYPKTADNKGRTQQFTFESRRSKHKPSNRSKEVQTEIQVDCRANLVNKILINDLDEFKKNVKEKTMFREVKRLPLQSRPEVQSTFATLISQQNVNKVRKQHNSFLQSFKHKPIEINCLHQFKTDISGDDLLGNLTFTNDRIKVVHTPNKNKVRSVSKNI